MTVVVTGLGAVTPLGGDVKSTWTAMLAGENAAVALEWAADLPARIAAPAAVDPVELLGRAARRVDRASQFTLLALREAWADAGIIEADPQRIGVVMGTGIGGVHTIVDSYETLRTRGARYVSPVALPMLMPNSPSAQASMEINAQAFAYGSTSACAAGADAIATGMDLIRAGRAEVVAVGATDASITPVIMAGFASMRALSTRNTEPGLASRPFDADRDGFVMAEGAGVLILEDARHAQARGARVYCTLAGAGVSAEAYHMASPHPDGVGMTNAMRKALVDADLSVSDVSHVNAHATSTPGGDVVEGKVIRSVLGAPMVSATKSMTGHLLGAAGAISAITSVLALHHRTAPPTINLDTLDPALDLDVVVTQPRPLPTGPTAVLTNAAGFGGHNVVLAFTH